MKTMTKEQLAELLNGNEVGSELTKEQEQIAKENNLLVLFGASDYLLEAKGTIHDEYGAGDFLLIKDGEMFADEDEDIYYKAKGDSLYYASSDSNNVNHPRLIRTEWCPKDESGLFWRITSNMPSSPFVIMRDGSPYCRGIVIDVDEIQ